MVLNGVYLEWPLIIVAVFPRFPFYSNYQWEFQDPRMEVLYHISDHILLGYSLKLKPEVKALYLVGTSSLGS